MTDERDKPSRAQESLARTTARDVPFVRGAGSESEPAPHGQRPGELPRDPTYEAELAQVELAVLRDRERRDDPSTKQGGRRGHGFAPGQAPESITPESPQARGPEVPSGLSPLPPSSGGRSVASGTLLSVGAVDPRGKTERTLETPRMFFSRPEQGGEAYFKPGKIPAVTVHQTLETETVKLADSIDPRRAKTIPRLDRAALAKLAELEPVPESDAAFALSRPEGLSPADFEDSPRWDPDQYQPAESASGDHDGQIHASLSPFRDQGEPSFRLDGAPTRPEPYVARQASEPPEAPESPVVPDTRTVPTHRDLPAHRIEASRPPPPPASQASPDSVPASVDGRHLDSEGPRPTTASIAGEEPAKVRPIWLNLAAFAAALLVALLLGWLVTGRSPVKQASPDTTASAVVASTRQLEPAPPAPAPTTNGDLAPAGATPGLAPTPASPAAAPAVTPAAAAKAPVTPAAPQQSSLSTGTPAAAAAHPASSPKPSHETIF